MKKSFLFFGATLAAVGFAVAPVNAQTQATTTTSSTTGYIQSSKIIGSKIRSADGSEVGVIKDIVLDRSTGCMAYTVLETSDGGNVAGSGSTSRSTTTTTISRKTVAMPWTAFTSTSDPAVYTTTVQRERIYSAPVYDYNRMEEYSRPDYISGVYSYYGVQPAVGVNIGINASSGGGRSGYNPQSGAGASTNPTATPAASVSPTVSPVASPSATASASPKATASVAPSATATASPKASASATAKPAASSSTATSPAAKSERSESNPAAKSEHTHSSSATTSSPAAVKSDSATSAKSASGETNSKSEKKTEKTPKTKGSAEPEAAATPSEP